MAKLGKRIAKSSRALIGKLEPSVEKAWHKSVRDLAANIDFAALKRAIEAEDMDAVDEALNLDGSFEALEKALVRSFEAGGKMTIKIISQAASEAASGEE